jgi:peptide/nickel transport system substrate-binding protein
VDGDLNLLPGLFQTEFETNDDLTQYTFHIFPEAVWSDGKPITAQDMVDWWHFIFQPALANPGARARIIGSVLGYDAFVNGETDTLEGLVAVDDKTLEVNLSRSDATLPLNWGYREAAPARVEQFEFIQEGIEAGSYPASTDAWGEMTARYFAGETAAELIVSGPFKFVHLSPEPDAMYIHERNPNWWGEQPYLTRIEGTTIRDFQSMLLIFENREADLLEFLSGPPAVLLRQQRPEVFHEVAVPAYWAMYFDTTKEPTDDVFLRKALMSAIEWEQLPAVAWEGMAGVSNSGSPMMAGVRCFDASFQPYPFDPEAAKAFLAQSAYGPDGANVPKIRILTAGSDPPRIRAAQVIQEFWRVHLGIEDVEIKNAESEFVDGQGLVNIQVTSGGSFVPLPGDLFLSIASTQSTPYNNWTHYTEEGWDEAILELTQTDVNSPEYCEMAQDILEEFTDAALVIPTAYIQRFYQAETWLKGYGNSRISFWYTPTDTYIAEH